jgi:hypothetical protein
MEYVAAIFPSAGVLFLFVLAIRAMFQADRRERLAQARMDLAADVSEASVADSAERSVRGNGPSKAPPG